MAQKNVLRPIVYRYFIYYESQLENGAVGHHHIFLELDQEIDNDGILNQVEKFLLKQNKDFKHLIITNFIMVGVFEKEWKENGKHN